MESFDDTFFIRLFPEATRFILPREADRFILVSRPARSCDDLNICCSSQCFFIMSPNSIDSSAEISSRKADTTSKPETPKTFAIDDAKILRKGIQLLAYQWRSSSQGQKPEKK